MEEVSHIIERIAGALRPGQCKFECGEGDYRCCLECQDCSDSRHKPSCPWDRESTESCPDYIPDPGGL